VTENGEVSILAYNQVDGFCTAAAALLNFPQARLVMTSASKIGRTFAKLTEGEKQDSEIHICGVGIYSDWEDVKRPAMVLKKRGVKIFWHCGRGYMEEWCKKLEKIGAPVLIESSTNTEAICRHFPLQDNSTAQKLISIAKSDPNIIDSDTEQSAFISEWRDLILSSISAYLKYQDEEVCPATIKKLVKLELTPEDKRAIAMYRKYSDKHILRGSSKRLQKIRRLIARCAEVDEPVIITGESGTGKEYAAQLIHERSRRAGEHFRPVNCATFTGNAGLANSTLFGHVKGAFTGATSNRKGAFRSANGGTLFLDEIALLPLEVQGKLLRVLESGVVIPEGSDEAIMVDARILAATNRDIPSLIRKGEFLPDLYHRINTLRIDLPPLKEHAEDIQWILREKIIELEKEGYKVKLTKKDYEHLAGYDWPGNVRQLFKLLKRVVYLGISIPQAIEDERKLGRLEYCFEEEKADGLLPENIENIKDFEEVKRIYFTRAWELSGRNYVTAKNRLKVSINTLRKYVGR